MDKDGRSARRPLRQRPTLQRPEAIGFVLPQAACDRREVIDDDELGIGDGGFIEPLRLGVGKSGNPSG